jgi:hypothetical protein
MVLLLRFARALGDGAGHVANDEGEKLFEAKCRLRVHGAVASEEVFWR